MTVEARCATTRREARSSRGAGFRRRRAIPILVAGVIVVLAETLAFALVLASPGSAPARAGPHATSRADAGPAPDNAARARRGLLPRKVVRTRVAARARRIVLVPRAPTWLGEPGRLVAPAAEGSAEPAVEPVAAALAPEGDEPSPLRAAVRAVAVEWLVVRRRADAVRPVIRATLAAPQIAAVMIRRRPVVAR